MSSRLPSLAALAAVMAAGAAVGSTLWPQVPVTPVAVDPPFRPEPVERLRVVVIGDTGAPTPDLAAVRAAIRAEAKDVIVAVGDLVYPLAPRCELGSTTGADRALLDERLGAALEDLGAPVLLALGNHDVGGGSWDTASEACLLDYAARHDDLVMPAPAYTVDYGVALLGIANSNAFSNRQADVFNPDFKRRDGAWKIMFAHDVLRTYHDKGGEDVVRPWLDKHRFRPHLYCNGHAHLLQFGVYGDIPALTTGTASTPRRRPECPPSCGPGQLFGSSAPGYAVVDITRERLVVTIKDAERRSLYRWEQRR